MFLLCSIWWCPPTAHFHYYYYHTREKLNFVSEENCYFDFKIIVICMNVFVIMTSGWIVFLIKGLPGNTISNIILYTLN